ncbi:hypothetical protein MBLNU230_g7833t1 [Neophaeotheca triangularis]
MRTLAVLPAALLALVTPILAHRDVSDSNSDTSPPDGLRIDTTRAVKCSHPSENGDKISMNYIGTLQSTGEEFDQSYKRGKPFQFVLGSGMVIKGWELGLLDMCPGEKRTLTIPPELAYGERGVGAIPGRSTLIFETEMMEIVGVEQESVSAVTATAPTTATGGFTIATAPNTPPEKQLPTTTIPATPTSTAFPMDPAPANGECRLLGPFALLVQAALGAVAILSLIIKRYRERPKRPWKIFTFDVSKQVLGSMLLHILNLALSMISSSSSLDSAAAAAQKQDQVNAEEGGERPNPCSYYMLNLGLDTTVGIPILYVLLRIIHGLAVRTPLANPPESIQSGYYGQTSPTSSQGTRFTWYLKQCLLYFIGLVGMKFSVFFLLQLLPWLPWVGDWALRWTEGNEALQIAFVMFVFPLCMNVFQYWVIDSFIKKRGGEREGYERVGQDSEGDEESRGRSGSGSGSGSGSVSGGESETIVAEDGGLKEAGATVGSGVERAKSPVVREEEGRGRD